MKIVAFAGGVGGAKLADGLAQVLSADELTIIVNTGDDFEHWGLKVCPDIDTVCYTLAGLANPETGWGRVDETWQVFESIQKLGGADWFRIGDKDLATHVERTRRLREEQALSEIVSDFCKSWGIKHKILPMSNQSIPTIVDTLEFGELAFQEYFVHQKCQPTVKGFRFAGADSARPAPGVVESIQAADAVVFCPSNPWVSIDPILSVLSPHPLRPLYPTGTSSQIWERGMGGEGIVVAVSPIIGGQTVKGPAAKMFAELGITPSALAVAEHYKDILTGFVLDLVDADIENDVKSLGMQSCLTNTLMKTREDRRNLALDVLNFIENLLQENPR